VLDACAAPGGKTGHLFERAAGGTRIVALDNDGRRLQRVAENLERLGAGGAVDPVQGDAGEPSQWWDGQPFQRILLDAPCSGTGVIRRHPDIKWLRREADIANLQRQQRRLLDALWPLLARGGRLVYATCSVLRGENEVTVKGWLEAEPSALEVPLHLPAGRPVAAGWQILTGEREMDGFYYACIEKR
jgi:16S rRNA (cytosine967-C5)-methyltransferase